MFSQTTEYALRVVVFLGSRKQSEPATTRQIAAVTRVPEGYLSKVLQCLGRAGLVESQRGLHGGSVLAVDPASLSVLTVIQAVDPIQRISSCPLNLKSHGLNLCPLHKRLDDAIASVQEVFARSTIADLINEQTSSPPLCDGHGHEHEKPSELTIGKSKPSPRRIGTPDVLQS